MTQTLGLTPPTAGFDGEKIATDADPAPDASVKPVATPSAGIVTNGQAAPSSAVGSQAAVGASRQRLLDLLTNSLVQKGPEMKANLERRVAAGAPLCVKGVSIGADILREALSIHARKLAVVAPAAPPAPTSARWTPSAPSSASVGAKVSQECEDAEVLQAQIRVVGGSKVAILAKPSVLGTPSGEYLRDGESADVIGRSASKRDGRVYLRLRSQTGWVSTRSRKDFSKTVLAPAPGGAPLEPPSFAAPVESRAVNALQRLKEDGSEARAQANTEGDAAFSGTVSTSRKFRVVARPCPILTAPSIANGSVVNNSALQLNEEISADGVHFVSAEHRAYLKLADGRGWVCERVRHDFHRFAVEPVDFTLASSQDDARRRKSAGDNKVIMVERSTASSSTKDEGPTTSTDARKKSSAAAAPVVYRSDAELWPESMGAPRPVDHNKRLALARLSRNYRPRILECEDDIRQAIEKADEYQISTDTEKDLRSIAAALGKEKDKMSNAWREAVEKVLDGSADSIAMGSTNIAEGNVAGVEPPESAEEAKGIFPAQVCGDRWHCAYVVADDGVRHLGPLRESIFEAQVDLHQLSDANAVPPEKRARVEDAEDAEMWRLRREIAQMRSELGETESAGTGNVVEEAAECDGENDGMVDDAEALVGEGECDAP